ncbi:MAG: twin-arginine translocase TatA/TatE family subunit [Candidatus Eremiobacteraeota bacterium]|nr:twin-arginine translocase TatA/TatE family subunit [Candidatus Eremiobacteraeota bacterium]
MIPVVSMIDAPIMIAIGAVVVLLFGADRLPKLARAMGQAKKEFDGSLHPPSPPPDAKTAAAPAPSAAANQVAPPSAASQVAPPSAASQVAPPSATTPT